MAWLLGYGVALFLAIYIPAARRLKRRERQYRVWRARQQLTTEGPYRTSSAALEGSVHPAVNNFFEWTHAQASYIELQAMLYILNDALEGWEEAK